MFGRPFGLLSIGYQIVYHRQGKTKILVDLRRVGLLTSAVQRRRSDQLSYRPKNGILLNHRTAVVLNDDIKWVND